jgi:pentose-5-phosphate-3-epimerase
VVAGSIDSRARIAAVAAAGADAFTIGSAVFDGSYAKRAGGTRAQLRAVLGDLAAVAAAA